VRAVAPAVPKKASPPTLRKSLLDKGFIGSPYG
jgi:hypothetical protein